MNKINLYDLGLDEKYTQEATMYSSDLHIGRVSVRLKNSYKVITEYGEVWAKISKELDSSFGCSLDYPTVGDWVLIDRTTDIANIHHRLGRKSFFEKKAIGTKNEGEIVASNIDNVFICMSLNTDLNPHKLKKYISVAWKSMTTPIVVLTKADLCHNLKDKLSEIKELVTGIDVLVTSTKFEKSYVDVKKYIKKGKTAAFIGSTGAGKSTLMKKILGEDVLKESEIRYDDKESYTTAYRELFISKDGGAIIDTPAMREIDLVEANLDKAIVNIEDFAKKCKFQSCGCKNEANCNNTEQVDDRTLDEDSIQKYIKIKGEVKYNKFKSKNI